MTIPDWFWKIFPVITGVAGYAGGIFSDSIKEWIIRRRLRRTLYIEIGWMYARLLHLAQTYRTESGGDQEFPANLVVPVNILLILRFDCFESAKREPMRFALLEDFASIEAAYLTLESLKVSKHYRDNREAYLHLIKVLGALDESVRKQRLDQKSLLKIDDPDFRKHVRALANSS